MTKAINFIKDAYVKVIDFIEDHPHSSLAIAIVLIVAALFV